MRTLLLLLLRVRRLRGIIGRHIAGPRLRCWLLGRRRDDGRGGGDRGAGDGVGNEINEAKQ